MGRKPKIQQTSAGSNGFDPDVLNSLVKRAEAIDAEKLSLHGAYTQDVRSLNEDFANIVDEAKARGVPPKPFKATLKERKLTRKIEVLREDLDLVDKESFDQIRVKLGMLADTPLGEAALSSSLASAVGAIDRGEMSVEFPGIGPNGETVVVDQASREAAAKNAEALAGMKTPKEKKPKLGGAEADGSYKIQ